MARHTPSVRQASTLIAPLTPASFSRIKRTPKDFISLEIVLQRIAKADNTVCETHRLVRLLNDKSEKPHPTFNEILGNLESNSKVHAEIQLIGHLRQQRCSIYPRVIAASKKSCYLCNAFISTQKIYVTPDTHGRIYPGWCLPSSGLIATDDEFLANLECAAKTRIEEILDTGVGKRNNPVESTAPPTMTTRSTVLSLEDGKLEEPQDSDSGGTVTPRGNRSQSTTSTPTTQPTVSSDVQETANGEVSPATSPDIARVLDANLDHDTAVLVGASVCGKEDGQHSPEVVEWRNVISGKVDCVSLSRSLSLYVEYSTGPARALKSLRFSTKSLSEDGMLDSHGTTLSESDLTKLEEVVCGADCEGMILKRGKQAFQVVLEALKLGEEIEIILLDTVQIEM
ncbi:hypothetical protein EDB81DRAFT_876705 [Dactylonectria macrodidyma]|uniref:Uncharacterized protein n=1 Tax=Dactylonectria macrodidyma TaxID=307937 RepID=A0A9P9FPG6_9HYPO|nr:hypothetical protein EDB81DRAFT_876705 [Dactylonectria macrodidyma]